MSGQTLSWKPVRDKAAGTYCSPACGVGCRRAEYIAAKESARIVCAKLGPNWRPYVWENVGWHWSVHLPLSPRSKARVELHVSNRRDLMFWASLEDLGHQRATNTVRGAERAVRNLIRLLDTEAHESAKAADVLRHSIGEK